MVKQAKKWLTLLISLLLSFTTTVSAWAGNVFYTVRYGESLWEISNRFGTTAQRLQETNSLGEAIYPGQKLLIPGVASYKVVAGDTLWALATRFNTTTYLLKKMNELTGDTLYAGQYLYIPDITQATTGVNYSNEDIYWLSRVISAEARGESELGQIAVGSVILNRVNNPSFPGSIKEVIFQYAYGVPQFSPVADGSIYAEPTALAVRCAYKALAGYDPTYGALYFYNPSLVGYQNWIRTRPVTIVIGNHVFAR